MNYKELKKKYPCFVYQDYSSRISKNNLEILFTFKIEPGIVFRPKVLVKGVPTRVNLKKLDSLIFHLGLIEMVSYWKTTCSPLILVKAGSLNSKQIKWWQDLIARGLGQFFFENKMPFQKPILATLKSSPAANLLRVSSKKTLVAVGGGKDSVITLESMKRKGRKITCFSLNPTEAARKIMRVAGCKKPLIVERKIDKKLLELNRKGFLNGHTPFSAYLAFLTVLLAAVFNYRYLVVSNEKGSSEGNVRYLGRTINHQWSKSFEFEKMFRQYSRKYLVRNVEYFSYLRSFSEIQIAKLFSRYPKYFPVFLSCNEAYKTASGRKKPAKKWCGRCSKCLFTFLVLYPFLEEKELIKIFGRNLFSDRGLLPLLEQLTGERGFKPFECVGTKRESRKALNLSLRKAVRSGSGEVPYLLTKIK